MRTRMALLALGLVVAAAAGARADGIDLKRYMPLAEVKPGMAGVGKTTLEGATIVEFQLQVLAVLKNVGPKRDLIICRCRGAGLEDSGVIAGMSGSPVYINGRLIGAVGYSFRWCKIPIAGVQPIEQMLRVTDEFPWTPSPRPATAGRGGPDADRLAARAQESFPVPVSALGSADVPDALSDRGAWEMQPIRTPVMVSGLAGTAMERLRQDLAPFGMVPMAGGGAETELPETARLEPGAPLAVSLVRGDIEMTTMGTITEIAGDRLYAFGHSMFGFGEADYPLMTGVAKVVIPSLMNSVRMGAAVKEVGRLAWDEQTGILGRLGPGRARMVPIRVKVKGPGQGVERTYACEMIHQRLLSGTLASTVAGGALAARTELPLDHTITYRLSVKPVGRDPIVLENLTVSPNGDAQVAAETRSLVTVMMENPFQNLAVESVDIEATVAAFSRKAEIEKSRPLRNAVRPGGTVPVELKIRPWREEPRWMTVDVQVPSDYPEGKVWITLCGADDALRQEMREAPARFQADDVESLLAILAREERRDRLFIRIENAGQGIAIGRDELPNLPETMRTLLAGAARKDVTGVTGAIVTTRPVPYVLTGGRRFEITVDRHAPEP